MKFSKKSLLAGCFFASCSSFAVSPVDGWYGGLMIGGSYAPNFRGNAPILTSITPSFFGYDIAAASLSHSLGVDGGGQIGYRYCNFRFEGQLVFDYNPFSLARLSSGLVIKRHVTPRQPIQLRGQTGFGALFFNGYYDFFDEEDDPTLIPYLGLGIGYSYIHNSINFSVPYNVTALSPFPVYSYSSTFLPTPLFSLRENKTAPIGQLILGLSYYMSDTSAINFDYRYFTTKTITSRSGLSGRVQAHTLNIGFNYWFGDM